jgi:hemolysin activation/secretion protein
MNGIWTELLLLADPGIFGSNSFSYGKFALTHRQYFTILPDQLSFAYRIAYQGKLYGTSPTYMLPFVFNAGRYTDQNGLGGAKTIRGILRNRIVGEDFAYGNFELRWKFLQTIVLNQNIYLALSAFTDMGITTREYPVDKTNVSEPEFCPDVNEGIHQSLGGGFRIALNQNFIIAVDYGVALDKRDGNSGLYINLNWLF